MDNRERCRVWVVFTNQTDLPYLRFLKKGFRHCFVIMHDGERWMSVDPMANYMEVRVQDVPSDFDLPAWLREQGHNVIYATLSQDVKRAAPIMIFTCVEACKRVLGIHKRRVFTPWQLYQYLQKN